MTIISILQMRSPKFTGLKLCALRSWETRAHHNGEGAWWGPWAGEGTYSRQHALELPHGGTALRALGGSSLEWLPFSPPPPHLPQNQGRLELPAGKRPGAPHRKFILQEHPIKWLMDSMRHKAGVKGAGEIKGKDV